jgi:hypothetical protein
MLLKIGERFELEVDCSWWRFGSVYLRAGSFERFWNAYGLPS